MAAFGTADFNAFPGGEFLFEVKLCRTLRTGNDHKGSKNQNATEITEASEEKNAPILTILPLDPLGPLGRRFVSPLLWRSSRLAVPFWGAENNVPKLQALNPNF